MVNERHYPHNHDDLVTVGGREVIFDSRGFEYVDGEVVVASDDLEAALRVLEKRYDGRVRDGEATSDVAVIEITVNADPLDIVARLTAALPRRITSSKRPGTRP